MNSLPKACCMRLNFLARPYIACFSMKAALALISATLRLRHAADELIRYPHLAVIEIAYGLGFKSASDFTRAFRRAYDMAPQDFRALAGKAV
jgi:AraC-like DNA-binding protein